MHYLVWKYSVFITRINDDQEVAAIQYNAIAFGMTIDLSDLQYIKAPRLILFNLDPFSNITSQRALQ